MGLTEPAVLCSTGLDLRAWAISYRSQVTQDILGTWIYFSHQVKRKHVALCLTP
jgi:hypothetical protein